MLPMLGHPYEPKRFSLPCYVQPKLDGVRAMSQCGRFQSRDEIQWRDEIVSHISQDLRSTDLLLDGEMYCHGMSLQSINSAIAVVRTQPTKLTTRIHYHVFDCVSYSYGFWDRWVHASKVVAALNSPTIHIVPVHSIESESQVHDLYRHYTGLGYEGVMVRVGNIPYTKPHENADKENRTYSLLKYKQWTDGIFPVVGLQSGRETKTGSKYLNSLGALVCATSTGATFNVGAGMSDIERSEWWATSFPVGRKAHVKYRLLSDTGIPLNPQLLTLL